MNLKTPHWFASASIAIALHIGVFVVALSNQTQGALAEGEHGIEIDLGMLGDFGEQAESQLAITDAKPEPKQESKPEPKPELKKELVQEKLEKIEKPEKITDVTPPAQEAERLVFEEKPKPEAQSEENLTNEETILVDDLVVKDRPIDEPRSEKLMLETNSAKNLNLHTQTKQSTGEENSLHNGGQAGADQSYLAKLLAQLAQHKRYPLSSRKKAEEGVTVLDFEISRTGRVLVSNIQQSSGFYALDKAVLVMLKRAEPFPPVPPDIKGESLRFTLPIAFKLNG